MNSPVFLLVSFPAGLSEKYHLLFPGLVFLTPVNTANDTFGNTS